MRAPVKDCKRCSGGGRAGDLTVRVTERPVSFGISLRTLRWPTIRADLTFVQDLSTKKRDRERASRLLQRQGSGLKRKPYRSRDPNIKFRISRLNFVFAI